VFGRSKWGIPQKENAVQQQKRGMPLVWILFFTAVVIVAIVGLVLNITAAMEKAKQPAFTPSKTALATDYTIPLATRCQDTGSAWCYHDYLATSARLEVPSAKSMAIVYVTRLQASDGIVYAVESAPANGQTLQGAEGGPVIFAKAVPEAEAEEYLGYVFDDLTVTGEIEAGDLGQTIYVVDPAQKRVEAIHR
jgi:hypothetical protein